MRSVLSVLLVLLTLAAPAHACQPAVSGGYGSCGVSASYGSYAAVAYAPVVSYQVPVQTVQVVTGVATVAPPVVAEAPVQMPAPVVQAPVQAAPVVVQQAVTPVVGYAAPLLFGAGYGGNYASTFSQGFYGASYSTVGLVRGHRPPVRRGRLFGGRRSVGGGTGTISIQGSGLGRGTKIKARVR